MFIVILIILALLLLTGNLIAISFGAVSIFGLYYFYDPTTAIEILGSTPYKLLNSFVYLSIPLFILFAEIFSEGKLGEKLVKAVESLSKRLPGGLAIACIWASAIFSAVSGSAPATAATVGRVIVPQMKERGYKKELILGLVASSGTLGIMIPPSIIFIIYGALTEQSIGKLFMAGILPGIILGILFSIYPLIVCIKGKGRPAETEPIYWKEIIVSVKEAFWALLAPVIVLGGIYLGLFTPTESSAIGVVYSLFVSMFIYKTLKLKDLKRVFINSLTTTSVIFFIMSTCVIFAGLVIQLEIPKNICTAITNYGLSPKMFLIIINLVLLGLGCVLDPTSVMLVTVPTLYPALMLLGIDPIWFGVIFCMNLQLAMITPPVGLNIYIMLGIDRSANIQQITRGVIPFAIIIFLNLLLYIVFPKLIIIW